jgi:hypothetical protein
LKRLHLIAAVLIFSVSSCRFIIGRMEEDSGAIVTGVKSDTLTIAFSGNINGETHPCGCRHFPLGGLPQVAGQLHELAQKGQVVYVDAGDTFFPSSVIPSTITDSLSFAASNLAKGLDQLGLKLHVPGDQDFARGPDFYKDIIKGKKFVPLLSNLKDPASMPHRDHAVIEEGPHKIFLLGVIDPLIVPDSARALFTTPVDGIKKAINTIKKLGYDPANILHRLVLISHSGYEYDEYIAQQFPDFDWILGAHSQKFTQHPLEVGKTKIVQVLSRNHYLGLIKIDLKGDRSKDSYEIAEMREEMQDKLKPNPFTGFIADHKAQMAKIQQEEQSRFEIKLDPSVRMNTSARCLECHTDQGKHWERTPHSLAFVTLLNANEANNLSCVKCHSVGLDQPMGFDRSSDMIHFSPEKWREGNDQDQARLDKLREAYMGDVKKAFGQVKSVRALSANELEKKSKQWLALDQKHGVTYNFMNVQCLNCHAQDQDHPFEQNPTKISRDERRAKIKDRCMECHDSDQSPEWYLKGPNGLPGAIDEVYIQKKIKEVGCPKIP